MRNYRFSDEGEKRFAAWMDSHLTYGLCPVGANVREIEGRLIKELKPPLNLTGWRNPQAGQLKTLRRVCCDEAWSARERRTT